MNLTLRIVLIVLLCCWSTATAWSQETPPPQVEAMWQSYQQLDYEAATNAAQAALQQVNRYGPDELAQIHIILGLIHYSGNQLSEARRQFMSALSLNATLELDSLLVSPKILSFFEEVRAETASASPEPIAALPVRYVVVQDRRAEAVLRSMVLPGWGQVYKGERTKGIVLLSAWGVAAASTGITYVRRRQTLRDYEAAATVDDALELYGPYNRWYQIHRAVLIGAAGLWLYSYVDALISRGVLQAGARFQVLPTSSAPIGATLRMRL